MKTKPVLITLTGPSCSGKSYLFNYIRDVAKLPCLISTTTRAPRKGEVEGVDYFFISEEDSIQLGVMDEFAELAIYNGVRYGVTRKEFHSKLSEGVAFLIVEPSGIDHYVQPALDVGAAHLKYYVHTDPAIRFDRFKDRVKADILSSLHTYAEYKNYERTMQVVASSFTRFQSMLTTEMQWGTAAQWDRNLMGDKSPAENLEIIQNDVQALLRKLSEL